MGRPVWRSASRSASLDAPGPDERIGRVASACEDLIRMNPSRRAFVVAAATALVITATASRAQTPPPPPPPPAVAPPDIRVRGVGAAFSYAGGDRERSAAV